GFSYTIATKGYTATTENYSLSYTNTSGGELTFEWFNGSFRRLRVNVPGLTLGTFHHVAATADGTNVSFYLDGTLVQTLAMPAPLLNTATGPLEIGGNAVSG